MKAAVLSGYGPPERVLQVLDVPRPEPTDNQVLVRVRATSVNDWDWAFARGKPLTYRLLFGLTSPKVRILGAELAGEVVTVGAGVRGFAPGDRVYGDVSDAGFGGFAEYVCLPPEALTPMPSRMTFEQAATIPHAALLAYQGLVELGGLRDGMKILVNGAGGGVGTFAIQIAKRHGAEVTGVDSGAKLPLLRDLGYDRVVDYQKEDFTAQGHTYDLILDTKSNRSARKYLRALAPGGAYITVGGTTARIVEVLLTGALTGALGGKRLRVLGLKPNRGLAAINAMFEDPGLRCVVDGPYPLSDIASAVRHFGEARHLGKVVIDVALTSGTATPPSDERT